VTRTLDEAYAWLTSSKGYNIEILPAQAFRDMVYQACMVGKQP